MASLNPISILAICGSLKKQSVNLQILHALSSLAPVNFSFHFYEGLVELPHFNPDHEEGNDALQQFRKLLSSADAVVISTPEYAFGLPGSLKNALDSVVGTGEFNGKVVAVVSASPLYSGGEKAMAALLPTLTALGTKTPDSLVLSIGNVKSKVDANGKLTDATTEQLLEALVEEIEGLVLGRY